MHGPLNDRRVRYIEMTPDEWARIPDNPRQRDTELHAKKAIAYLSTSTPSHAEISMAVLPEGSRYKLDGHTRSWLWSRGMIPVPPMLHVTVYEVWTYNEVIEAYEWFDNQAAAERGPDVLQGAFKANGLRVETSMLRKGRMGTALRRLFLLITKEFGTNWHDYTLVYEAVRYFAREIPLLDAMNPTPKLFPPGIQMAALITLKRDHDDALEFWKLYAAERGNKTGEKMDAVQALIEATLRSKGRLRNTDIAGDLFGKGVSAFQSFQARDTYLVGGSGVRPLQLTAVNKYISRSRGSLP